ncbi:hypothetical protein HD553DRAFT_344132 [Filobasidium floriforme]|uniref:uncharacterized protein n=1 Tax=Filobasidium floriforme TaxID=5210 RepID=UPI001E8E0DC8|nr:uncharacterized protein HD553DRAFT_344132 [Filobasidium floriforme]KAH8081435.1 hypothetical protein HD553DRAFT_344132 [Filobasidium floriforme]
MPPLSSPFGGRGSRSSFNPPLRTSSSSTSQSKQPSSNSTSQPDAPAQDSGSQSTQTSQLSTTSGTASSRSSTYTRHDLRRSSVAPSPSPGSASQPPLRSVDPFPHTNSTSAPNASSTPAPLARVAVPKTPSRNAIPSAPYPFNSPSSTTSSRPATNRTVTRPAGLPAYQLPAPGQAQREAYQDQQNLRLEVQDLRTQFSKLNETVTTLAQALEAAQARENAMEEELTFLRTQVLEEDGQLTKGRGKKVSVSDPDRSLITTFVRSAIEVLHGGKAFTPSPFPKSLDDWPRLTAASGEEGDPVMRWDYSLGAWEGVNKEQTANLIRVLEHQRNLPPLPYGTHLDSIPPYNGNCDVYERVIKRQFAKYASTLQTKLSKEWMSSDDRSALMDEIGQLELAERDEDDEDKLDRLKAELLEKDNFAAETEAKTSTNLRSKLRSMANAITQKRKATPKYRDSKWNCLDSVYVQPGLSVEKDEGKFVWYEADWDAFYSEEYLNIWKEINNSKPKGIRARGADFTQPTDGAVRLPVQPYLPSDLAGLSLSLQRWMIHPEILSEPEWEDFVSAYVVPVDFPTDPADVCKLTWWKDHSMAFAKTPAAPAPASHTAKKRKLEDTDISDRGPSDSPLARVTPLPLANGNGSTQSITRTPSESAHTPGSGVVVSDRPEAGRYGQHVPSSPVRDEPRLLFRGTQGQPAQSPYGALPSGPGYTSQQGQQYQPPQYHQQSTYPISQYPPADYHMDSVGQRFGIPQPTHHPLYDPVPGDSSYLPQGRPHHYDPRYAYQSHENVQQARHPGQRQEARNDPASTTHDEPTINEEFINYDGTLH